MTPPRFSPSPRHARPIRHWFAIHVRLVVSLGAGCLAAGVLMAMWPHVRPVTALLVGWNAYAAAYIGLVLQMMRGADRVTLKVRASREDESRAVILLLTLTAAVASLAAVVVELGQAKSGGTLGLPHAALAGLTVLLSWTLIHTIFALHYAHEFYAATAHGGDGGLKFEGAEPPVYSDFLYVSFVIGTSAQTADVSFTSRRSRKLALVHCCLAFLFNAAVLALAVNIGAGLI